jgi:hypothetical protein
MAVPAPLTGAARTGPAYAYASPFARPWMKSIASRVAW